MKKITKNILSTATVFFAFTAVAHAGLFDICKIDIAEYFNHPALAQLATFFNVIPF